MRVDSAVALVNQLIYKPGWKITASDMSKRHESCIRLDVSYSARMTERELAPAYEKEIDARAAFLLTVGDCADDVSLYRKVMNTILRFEEHEAREFFRIQPSMWAPFHPHRVDGQQRWGDPQGDLLFGLASF